MRGEASTSGPRASIIMDESGSGKVGLAMLRDGGGMRGSAGAAADVVIEKDLSGEPMATGCIIPPQTLLEMVKEENELRLSSEMQRKFADVEVDTSFVDWLMEVEQMQLRLVQRYGFGGVKGGRALLELRCAAQLYPHITAFREIPLYVKYNRAKRCDVREGEAVPLVMLTALSDGSIVTLEVR